MKIPINLATHPFRRDRAMIMASLVVCFLLVGTLGVLIKLARQDSQQLGDVRHEVAMLKQQVQAVSAQQAKLNAVIHNPQNETVSSAASSLTPCCCARASVGTRFSTTWRTPFRTT